MNNLLFTLAENFSFLLVIGGCVLFFNWITRLFNKSASSSQTTLAILSYWGVLYISLFVGLLTGLLTNLLFYIFYRVGFYSQLTGFWGNIFPAVIVAPILYLGFYFISRVFFGFQRKKSLLLSVIILLSYYIIPKLFPFPYIPIFYTWLIFFSFLSFYFVSKRFLGLAWPKIILLFVLVILIAFPLFSGLKNMALARVPFNPKIVFTQNINLGGLKLIVEGDANNNDLERRLLSWPTIILRPILLLVGDYNLIDNFINDVRHPLGP